MQTKESLDRALEWGTHPALFGEYRYRRDLPKCRCGGSAIEGRLRPFVFSMLICDGCAQTIERPWSAWSARVWKKQLAALNQPAGEKEG